MCNKEKGKDQYIYGLTYLIPRVESQAVAICPVKKNKGRRNE